MVAQAQLKAVATAAEDSAKRRQIIQGAREIFLARGFDAASMSDIARAAGVSKGTLYVYFENKEQLFEAIVHEECQVHAEGAFTLDYANHDVAAVLTRLGTAYLEFLCTTEKASALRTVVAIAERMPEIGRVFYETGPAVGIAKLADYLKAQNDAGILAVEDCTVAAAQFLDACKSTLFMPVLFNFSDAPQPEAIRHVVGIAVRTFLRAYQANP
ncbi:MAG TPA: TetR/AcrR family transcriptional regulator [Xanthobacteraceae bacterium]|nr:TetR/AcrR family transcriptional regulator [Xanthobacteraceae bacterium]